MVSPHAAKHSQEHRTGLKKEFQIMHTMQCREYWLRLIAFPLCFNYQAEYATCLSLQLSGSTFSLSTVKPSGSGLLIGAPSSTFTATGATSIPGGLLSVCLPSDMADLVLNWVVLRKQALLQLELRTLNFAPSLLAWRPFTETK